MCMYCTSGAQGRNKEMRTQYAPYVLEKNHEQENDNSVENVSKMKNDQLLLLCLTFQVKLTL